MNKPYVRRMIINAPAKVNLTLDIFGKRPDGYHNIRSVMQTVTLMDTLTVTTTPGQPGITLEVIGPESDGVPADCRNLVWKAASRVQEIAASENGAPEDGSGFHIILDKHIPSQAGLGGGSSDAAAALRATARQLDLQLTATELREIAATLGADVPFFVNGGTALVEGIGEIVSPLPAIDPNWNLIIVKPDAAVSTAGAYAKLDAMPGRSIGDATTRWLSGAEANCLGNDFEQVIVSEHPAVANIYDFLQQRIHHRPLLCGSGSAVFCLADDEHAAQEIANQTVESGLGKAWVASTIFWRSWKYNRWNDKP